MEADLPLLKISEEDDSLIQQFPDPNRSSFTCSPFALLPSHSKSVKDNVRVDKPSGSSSETSNNKENLISSNIEVPKLGMEPMQMKRKKKAGGGYNLRKSLAWDRAFFTEEGILDPRELNLITGIDANTCGGGLSTISEEGNSSCSSDSRRCRNEYDTDASEEALTKQLRDNSRTPKGNRDMACSSARNRDSLPHHRVTNKIPSINRTNRAGSNIDGCSKPLAASSLKRPANSNILKTARKESKLPKLPLSKPRSSLSATTKGSMTGSQLRQNLIPKPATNVQKSVGLKSSVKNVHVSQSKAKTGSGSLHMPAKDLVQKSVKNLASSSKEASSTKSRLVQADRANTGSETVPDRLQLHDFQEESASLATKSIATHTATDLNNSLSEAARLTSSGLFHIRRASNEKMIPNKLQSCENQERPAAVTAPHHMKLAEPPNIQPARPSGLRLPSPSLRFFGQKTDSESGTLQQKKTQQSTTIMGSNRKNGDIRPSATPARTPLKSNDITENICSVVLTSRGQCHAPSTLSAPCSSTQLRLTPNNMGNTTKGVPYSSMYPNLEREIAPMLDTKVQHESKDSEFESHKVIEQEIGILGHEETMETEKIACKNEEGMKVSHPTEQLEEANDASIHFAENVGYNKVGVGTCQLISKGDDGSVPLVPETKEKLLHYNEEDRWQGYTAISLPTSEQSIQLQKHNISTMVGGTSPMQDLAQTPKKQAYTEKSDVSKVNLEFHMDAGRLEAIYRVSEVFEEFQKDGLGKREDDHGATQWVGPSLENCVVLEHENPGQENAAAEIVDAQILHTEPDARYNTGSPCSATDRGISITSRDSLEDEAGNDGNTDAIELKGKDTMMDTSCISFQCMSTEQRNDDTDGLVPTRSPVRDVGTLVLRDHPSVENIHVNPSTSINDKAQLQVSPVTHTVTLLPHDNPSAEGYHIEASTSFKNKDDLHDSPERDAATLLLYDDLCNNGAVFNFTPSTSIKKKVQRQDSGMDTRSAKSFEATTCISALPRSQFSEGRLVNCIISAESSSPGENPGPKVTEINDHLFQEINGSNHSSATRVEVPDQKHDVVDVALLPGQPLAEVQLKCEEVTSLIDDPSQSSLSHLRLKGELISEIASVDSQLKKESVLQMPRCGTTYPQTLQVEGLDIAAATIEDKNKIREENQKSQEIERIIGNLSEKSIVAEKTQHLYDSILEASQTVQGSSGGLTTYSHFQSENQILEGSGTVSSFSQAHVEEQVQLLDGELVQTCSRLKSVSHNHSIENVDYRDVSRKQPEFANTGIELDRNDVYDCDPKKSDTIMYPSTVGQEVGFHYIDDGQLCVAYATLGSPVTDSRTEENHTDRQNLYNIECGDLAHLSELESSGEDKTVDVNRTCTQYNSANESMLEKKETLFGALFDIEQVLANDRVFMKDILSPAKIANIDKLNNAFDSVLAPEQSVSHGCDLQSHDSGQIFPIVQENVSDLNGDNQPNEPQDFVGILPSIETYDICTDGQSGCGVEFCVQFSQSKSSLSVSQQPKIGVKTTSTTLCLVPAEICSVSGEDESLLTSAYMVGAEGLRRSIEEVEAEVLQEGKSPMVGEASLELDGGSDLKENKDATVMIKRSNNMKKQDNSLVIHPPNAVPFSDEWLAAIEAAGEEILTMKCGAVQHSPPDKSLPEPSPWSPVKKKANKIGPYDCTKYTNGMPSNSH